MFLVKREESRSFDVFFGVWKREKMRREAELRAKLSNFFFPLKVPGAIYNPVCVFGGGGPSRTVSLKRPLIWLILTPLERSWLPISEKVCNLKIQWLDQKLWLSEVCGALISAPS